MTDLVFLRHPDLPPDQWIEVPEESRFHYSPAGWQVVSDADVADREMRGAHAVAVTEARMAGLPLPPEPVRAHAAAGPTGPAADGPEPESDSMSPTAPAASKRSK